MKSLLAAAVVLFAVAPSLADDARSWEGTWNNKKYGTTGPLKCVAKPGEKQGTWDATFTGTFKGDPFEYKVNFDATPMGEDVVLGGKATISGDHYDWKGSVRGKTLTGEYRSKIGYYGSFTLTEK